MQTTIIVAIGFALAVAALPAEAATKAPEKAAPACSAISFRPLPPGMSDGEQQAGMYKSRHGRLELRAEVEQGNPSDYYVTSAGKRVAAAPCSLPEAAATCAAVKEDAKTRNSGFVFAAANGLPSSSPTLAISAWHCFTVRITAAGISVPPARSEPSTAHLAYGRPGSGLIGP